MLVSPTLTADEFKKIHNAKCELHGLVERMRGVVDQSLVERLVKAIAEIDLGLKAAYEQDEAVAERNSAHHSAVAAEISATSLWSLHEVSDMYAPHPYQGVTELVYSQHWGQKPVQVVILGKTWKDLFRAADKAIRKSGDSHHVFIEGFTRKEGADHFRLELNTGS